MGMLGNLMSAGCTSDKLLYAFIRGGIQELEMAAIAVLKQDKTDYDALRAMEFISNRAA
jgi:hypothetical protein